jgi:hypothetical protein
MTPKSEAQQRSLAPVWPKEGLVRHPAPLEASEGEAEYSAAFIVARLSFPIVAGVTSPERAMSFAREKFEWELTRPSQVLIQTGRRFYGSE